jgi:hypothetical protein
MLRSLPVDLSIQRKIAPRVRLLTTHRNESLTHFNADGCSRARASLRKTNARMKSPSKAALQQQNIP